MDFFYGTTTNFEEGPIEKYTKSRQSEVAVAFS
jgi:hypothetical protein